MNYLIVGIIVSLFLISLVYMDEIGNMIFGKIDKKRK